MACCSQCQCHCRHSISPNYNHVTSSSESLQDHGPHLCAIRRSNVLLSFYLPFYVLFLVAGAFIFNWIERNAESELRITLREDVQAFKQNHQCVSDHDLEDFMAEIIRAKMKGVSALRNASGESIWSFGQSLFFASTVVTTIGYGSTHPLTEGGKVFCVFYAIVGIPLTFVLLAALVERLLTPVVALRKKLERYTGEGSCESVKRSKVLCLAIVGVTSTVFFLLVPAVIFSSIEEDWAFLDAFYYCFISLTTVGLGDYTPGDNVNQPFRALYKVCTTGYLLVGLTFVMLVLHLFNDIPQLNLGHFLLLKSDESDSERLRLTDSHGGSPNSTRIYSNPVTDPKLPDSNQKSDVADSSS